MLNSPYDRWLVGDCCCESRTTPIDCGDKEQCSCENILLEISNLHTDINVVSGEVENKQDKLSAGTGIEITEDNVINCTANPDLSNYYTKEETDLLIPTEVSELNNDAGYLTEHQPLKTINGEVISGSGNIVIEASGGSITVDDHLDSASTNPVENKVIVEALNDKLDASAYTPVSLSGYATEQWVEDKHYITGVDLSNYATLQDIPVVPTSNSAFTNDMHYITSAETANYVTSGNVETQITNHFWCGTQNEYNALPTKSNNVLYLIHE